MGRKQDLQNELVRLKRVDDDSLEKLLGLYGQIKAYCRNPVHGNLFEFKEYFREESWDLTWSELDDLHKEYLRVKALETSSADDEVDKQQLEAEYLRRDAEEMISGTFARSLNQQSHNLDTFKIVDENLRVVVRMPSKATDDQLRSVIREATQNRTIHYRRVNAIIEQWNLNGRRIDYPTNHGWIGTFDESGNDWVYHRCDIPAIDVPTPLWDSWLNRLSDPDAWLAWIYGVLSHQWRGRQVLWVEGEGLARKSFASRVIGEYMYGPTYSVIDGMTVRAPNAQFLTAGYIDSALIVWDDCANSRALMTEAVKMLSPGGSGNRQRIEGKGADAYFTKLESRIMINSNKSPELTGEKSIRSRLVYIHVANPTDESIADTAIEPKYVAELPGLLFKAKAAYERVVDNDFTIKQNEFSSKKIDDFENKFYSDVSAVVDEILYLEDDAVVDVNDLRKECETSNSKYKHDEKFNHLLNFLTRRCGVVPIIERTSSDKKTKAPRVLYKGVGLVSQINMSKTKSKDKQPKRQLDDIDVKDVKI